MTRSKAELAREQAALAKKRQKIEHALAVADRRDAGITVEEIARELGMSVGRIEARLYSANWYREQMAELAKEPTDISALAVLGQMPDFCNVGAYLRDYGVTALRHLAEQEWSRAEVASVYRYLKPLHLDRLEETMAQFGLKLHPDREKPIEREVTEEEQVRRDGVYDPEDDWAKIKDRDFIVEQARRVAEATHAIWMVLDEGTDDPRYYTKAARFLQRMPDKLNAMVREGDRLIEAANSAAALKQVIEARAEANRPVAELAIAMAGTGNVLPFPARLH